MINCVIAKVRQVTVVRYSNSCANAHKWQPIFVKNLLIIFFKCFFDCFVDFLVKAVCLIVIDSVFVFPIWITNKWTIIALNDFTKDYKSVVERNLARVIFVRFVIDWEPNILGNFNLEVCFFCLWFCVCFCLCVCLLLYSKNSLLIGLLYALGIWYILFITF